LNVRRKDVDKPLVYFDKKNFPSALSLSHTFLTWTKKRVAILKIDLVHVEKILILSYITTARDAFIYTM